MTSFTQIKIKVLSTPVQVFILQGEMIFKNEIEMERYLESLENHFEYWMSEEVEVEAIEDV